MTSHAQDCTEAACLREAPWPSGFLPPSLRDVHALLLVSVLGFSLSVESSLDPVMVAGFPQTSVTFDVWLVALPSIIWGPVAHSQGNTLDTQCTKEMV